MFCLKRIVLCIMPASLLYAETQTQSKLVFDHHVSSVVAQHYAVTAEPSVKTLEEYIEYARAQAFDAPKAEQLRRAYMHFEADSALPTVDSITIDDLAVLTAPHNNFAGSLASSIPTIRTSIGSIALMRRLTAPTADAAKLYQRQILIKLLLADEELYNEVRALVESYAEIEQILVGINPEHHIESFLTSHFQPQNPFLPKNIEQEVYQNKSVAGIPGRYQQLTNLAFTGSKIASGLYMIVAGGSKNSGRHIASIPLFGWILESVQHAAQNAAGHNKIAKHAASIGLGSILLYSAYMDLYNLQLPYKFELMLHAKLCSLAQYFEDCQKLQALLQREPLFDQLDTEHALSAMFDAADDASYWQLCTALRDLGFATKDRWISNLSLSLATLNLYKQHRHRLMTGMRVIGELDALLACVDLIKSSTPERPWCLPKFELGHQQPYVQVQDGWLPMVKALKPVLNSMELGGVLSRTILISGPNAGGKSTFIRMLMTECWLALTLGVCSAQSCTLTPFELITTYFNVVDDPAKGVSHFEAGALRALEVVQQHARLKPHQFALIGLDEIFDGTQQDEGKAAAAALIAEFGKKENVICVAISHFAYVTELENKIGSKLFRNYKVAVDFDEQGRIVYRYKIERGITDQCIAFNILREKGLSAEFLQEAEHNLKEIKKLPCR